MISNPKVVITDYDYGDLEIEKGILHGVGAEVIPLQAKCEEDLFEAAEDCFGMINQYARVGRETIQRMKQCKVIARYGVGVDIVDVDAATEWGILVTNLQDYCTEEVKIIRLRYGSPWHENFLDRTKQPVPVSGIGKRGLLFFEFAEV